MTVLVLDQFCGLTPYQLQQEPIAFIDLLPGGAEWEALNAAASWRKPKVLELDEKAAAAYRPPWATTVLKAGIDGKAEVWKARWDSSG